MKHEDYDSDASSTSDWVEGSNVNDRDEIEEVKRMSTEDTDRVRRWRLTVAACLLITAIVITATTYHFLRKEQLANFEEAYDQFSRTLGDAALGHQHSLREGFQAFADSLTLNAMRANATWPFVTIPNFEADARHFRQQTGAELINLVLNVTGEQREAWEKYAIEHYEAMIQEAHLVQKGSLERLTPVGFKPFISKLTQEGFVPQDRNSEYFASWHYTPPPATYGLIGFDALAVPDYAKALQAMIVLRNQTLITPVRKYVGVPTAMSQDEHDALHSALPDSNSEHPHSVVVHPIHERIDDPDSPIVALFGGGIAWDFALRNLLPHGVRGMMTVIKNTCNQSFTYEIDGRDALFKGAGDSHNTKYDRMEVFINLALSTHADFDSTPGHCRYSMHIYPSPVFENSYYSKTPVLFAFLIAITFTVVIVVFFVYDMNVQRRNDKLVITAAKSNAIVSSLFPGQIRDRLIRQDVDNDVQGSSIIRKSTNLTTYLKKGGSLDMNSKPLAELYLDTTVLFADIVGFTAWSSVREPSQVFTLLETVYAVFDDIAGRRRVYKVKTVGDCYVAVTGLPEPRKDHAVIMARFARDIHNVMAKVTIDLEKTLGPGTGELSLRVGMHSDPVTAGVLRGERARFQLFGDTVNTCARMESSGEAGRVHVSKETADLLVQGGKEAWIIPREDTVHAKGKGELKTFYLQLEVRKIAEKPGNSAKTSSERDMETEDNTIQGRGDQMSRLIDWNVQQLTEILRLIIAKHHARSMSSDNVPSLKAQHAAIKTATNPLDEVKEIITLPVFDSNAAKNQRNHSDSVVPDEALDQIRDYVTCIASMYRRNPFHNFDHASHVVMSAMKLLSRIVAPDNVNLVEGKAVDDDGAAASLHDHTYGITSDPLTQFACAFSALVHDVDHTGVPNTQLGKENKTLAALYKNRSVAEQNSLDLSWDLFMDDRYALFRRLLCPTQEELVRFRQLVVNIVMATDIMDKDLKKLRNDRWDRAFSKDSIGSEQTSKENINRKATIVIEHLIQASDVAHTMQHWHVYRKWNEKLFREMYKAFLEGRAERNPAEFWYDGEIGFLDFYVIPLAKKLKDCGVFGVSSDEYLSYATANRAEWERRGKAIVAEMIQNVEGLEVCLGG